MWYNKALRGQAMLEYVLAFAALLVLAGVMSLLVKAAGRSAERTERLVASDYP